MNTEQVSGSATSSTRAVRVVTQAVAMAVVGILATEARADESTPIVIAQAGAAPSSATADDDVPRIRIQADRVRPPYLSPSSTTAMRTDTPLRDIPQAITVVTEDLITDQAMQSMSDVVRYVPGATMGQGEGHRDQPTLRGNGSTADFFVNGIRDDVQYFRDVYNLERVEAIKGPNAMIFGRGGGGGVINRVTKDANWNNRRAVSLQGGSYDRLRGTLDVGHAFGDSFALRLNAMQEDSDSYRDDVRVERYGINPTATFIAGDRTVIRVGYEYFDDERTVDRGVPSFNGRPLRTDASTFFGDPDLSYSDAKVNVGYALIEHQTAGGLTIRNNTRYADYAKFYQNVYPSGMNGAGTEVRYGAYNNLTNRDNLFNQTDIIWSLSGAGLKHTLLAGVEVGRQDTENLRNTGYFNNTSTSYMSALSNPTISVPVTFRQSASDANNRVEADVAAVYLQDQIDLSSHWQAVIGLRYDNFDLDYRDNRSGAELSRDDDLVSPRAGLIYKPVEPVSLYASYSISYLPSSGDQFSSLTVTTQALEPEEFENYEVGAKWDVRSDLALTAAVYQLDRSKTTATDPVTGRTVQTGSQRSRGVELGITGTLLPNWRVMGGYAYQDAEITSDTSAARAGLSAPLTPEHTVSLWNRYDLSPAWGLGLGVIHQDEVFSGPDNLVELPSFTRVDAAVFLRVSEMLSAQLNVENLFDEDYYPTAHSNSNITPGSPTAFRLTFTTSF